MRKCVVCPRCGKPHVSYTNILNHLLRNFNTPCEGETPIDVAIKLVEGNIRRRCGMKNNQRFLKYLEDKAARVLHAKCHLRDFGRDENTSYISRDFIRTCFKERNILALIRAIHFHPDHPENHNVTATQYVDGGNGEWRTTSDKLFITSNIRFNAWRLMDAFFEEEYGGRELIVQADAKSKRWLDTLSADECYGVDAAIQRMLSRGL